MRTNFATQPLLVGGTGFFRRLSSKSDAHAIFENSTEHLARFVGNNHGLASIGMFSHLRHNDQLVSWKTELFDRGS